MILICKKQSTEKFYTSQTKYTIVYPSNRMRPNTGSQSSQTKNTIVYSSFILLVTENQK